MVKRIKISLFVLVIIIFTFFILKYYFSDNHKKKYYRSFSNIDEKILNYSYRLPILEDDTKNSIEYVEQSNSKKKKRFNFWELLESNE